METQQKTCEQRIDQHLRDRIEDMPTSEYLLSVDKAIVYTVELSTGGPADFFKVFIEYEEISRIEYHFQDWFDGAMRVLSGDEFDFIQDWIYQEVYLEEIM